MLNQLRFALSGAIALGLAVCAAACCQAGCISFTAKSDTQASVYLHSANPVVFEIGKLRIPWRRINDVTDKGHVLTWQVRKGRTYEVWDARDYARAQLREAGESLGHPFSASGDLSHAVLSAIKWTKSRATSEPQQLALTRLETAMAALLNVKIEIQAGVRNKVWPEYTLPITCSFSCPTRGVTARLAALTKPDSWTEVGRQARAGRSTIDVRLPSSATRYQGGNPVIARYEVKYRGTSFMATNAVEASVVDAFEREAWIDTISDTQIDLHVRLTSLLPIKDVTAEAYLPDGWTATTSPTRFDVANTRDVTYRITRPRTDDRGLRIVGGTFHAGEFTTSKRLLSDHALELGETAAVTGFRLIRTPGEPARVTTISDRKCRQVPASGMMSFDVSVNFSPGTETYLTVQAAATGPGSMTVQYVTTSGEKRSTQPQTLNADSGWRDLVFVLRDAAFNGKLPDNADFVLSCSGSMPGIAGIYISRFRTP